MAAIAAGMESDLSDEDCDMGFSKIKSTNPNKRNNEDKKWFPQETIPSNGSINHSVARTDGDKSSMDSKFRPQNRNHPQHMRRQCIDFKSSQQLDDLRYAIVQGNLETTTDILSKGIFVDTILKAGWTGLMYASSSGHPDIVSFLLEKKADPNYHKDMFTSLMAVCAAKRNEEDLLKCCLVLLKYKAKVNAHERHFTTPLMFAVREGYSLIVKVLLDHGAALDVQDNRGNTALAWASTCGYGQIIRILLERGASLDVINTMGRSPADLAYENGHSEVSSLLQKGHILNQMNTPETTTLVPKQVSNGVDISNATSNTKENTFTFVGDLDLFLSGIGLPDLIPKFTEQQLNFNDLLIMDDGELEKMGISQVGVRKQLLEACKSVHKKQWENSSLPNLKQSQFISCPDAVAMMANIAKHLKYISSSVIYIRQQIQLDPRILELSKDSANIYNLLDEMHDSLKNIRNLNDELKFLKIYLEKVQDSVQYKQADLIKETIQPSSKQKIICTTIVIAVTSFAAASFLWKYPYILDSIPVYIRIKIPFLT